MRTPILLCAMMIVTFVPAVAAAKSADPAAVVERFFAAYRAADVNRMLETYAPDAVFVDVSQRKQIEGREQLRAFLAGLTAVHHRMDIAVKQRVAKGDRVVVEHAYEGMLSGEGLHATSGRDGCRDTVYSIPTTSWFEVKDGRIVRQTDYVDLETLKEVKQRAMGS